MQRLGRSPDPRRHAGRRAEWLAAWRLRLAGWTVLGHDIHVAGVQVDIVAERGGVVAIIEVKWRGHEGPPTCLGELVTAGQLRRLQRAARAWANRPRSAGRVVRIDLVVVQPGRFLLPRIRHHEDVGRS